MAGVLTVMMTAMKIAVPTTTRTGNNLIPLDATEKMKIDVTEIGHHLGNMNVNRHHRLQTLDVFSNNFYSRRYSQRHLKRLRLDQAPTAAE